MNENIIIASVSLISFIFIWLTFGYVNYRRFMLSMDFYEETYRKHEQLEKTAPTVELKTKHFNEKENLINKYPRLHEVLLTKQEQGEGFYKRLLLSFLKYGFLYNVR